jgi:hypothetical protein
VNKDELDPIYDYTVDYRRYSYADFEVSDAVGSSTVLPEMLAAWIDKAIPRNQDDVYPLYVLCKDLLRKFCLSETRYSFKVRALICWSLSIYCPCDAPLDTLQV